MSVFVARSAFDLGANRVAMFQNLSSTPVRYLLCYRLQILTMGLEDFKEGLSLFSGPRNRIPHGLCVRVVTITSSSSVEGTCSLFDLLTRSMEDVLIMNFLEVFLMNFHRFDQLVVFLECPGIEVVVKLRDSRDSGFPFLLLILQLSDHFAQSGYRS